MGFPQVRQPGKATKFRIGVAAQVGMNGKKKWNGGATFTVLLRTFIRRVSWILAKSPVIGFVAAMRQDLAKIQTTITPVLQGLGATAGRPEARTAAAAWQPASEQMLASARHVETLLAVVLGVAPAGSTTDAPGQLLTALRQLTTDIEQCQRLLSYD